MQDVKGHSSSLLSQFHDVRALGQKQEAISNVYMGFNSIRQLKDVPWQTHRITSLPHLQSSPFGV